MSDLIGKDRLGPDGDVFYELLMAAHEGLSEAESHALNMRLVLMLANELGDIDRIARCLRSDTSSGNKKLNRI